MAIEKTIRAHTGTCMNTHVHTHTCMHTHIHLHVHTHARTGTCTHMHMHEHTHAYMCMHMHIHLHVRAHMHTRALTPTCSSTACESCAPGISHVNTLTGFLWEFLRRRVCCTHSFVSVGLCRPRCRAAAMSPFTHLCSMLTTKLRDRSHGCIVTSPPAQGHTLTLFHVCIVISNTVRPSIVPVGSSLYDAS